jgi:dUTP pyrophosphatase
MGAAGDACYWRTFSVPCRIRTAIVCETARIRTPAFPLNYSVAMLSARIRRLTTIARLPEYESAAAAGFDLAASEDVTVAPGEVRLVPTGLVIEVPAGMFLGIFARSSTPLKRGLMVANGVGVVDPDYCGPMDEVKIAVLNFSSHAVTVTAGDRIAQGIFLPAARVTWEESGEVRKESRGGFGSTGGLQK